MEKPTAVYGTSGVRFSLASPIKYFKTIFSSKEVAEDQVIFYSNGQWHFWNETWSYTHGPFKTREICRQELKNYCEEELGV